MTWSRTLRPLLLRGFCFIPSPLGEGGGRFPPPLAGEGRVGAVSIEEESVKRLRCRECGRLRDFEPAYVCENCFGPLEVAYDLDAIRQRVSRHTIADGPASIWRYRELLPAPAGNPPVLGTRFPPLVEEKNLGEARGLHQLVVKDHPLNPAGALKDRHGLVGT